MDMALLAVVCLVQSAVMAGNGMSQGFGCKPIDTDNMQGAQYYLAGSVELRLRPLLPVEDPWYSRHISLETPDNYFDRCWVRNSYSIYRSILTTPSLPGTPLWLVSVYSKSLAPLTKYWIPAFWLVYTSDVPSVVLIIR